MRGAYARGMAVNFNITGPAPLWVTGSPERQDIATTYTPSAREFDLFVRAVGNRYGGQFMAGGSAVPRVDYWSIWNEPNQAGWLTPQWLPDPRRKGRWYEVAPKLYRSLVAARVRRPGRLGPRRRHRSSSARPPPRG